MKHFKINELAGWVNSAAGEVIEAPAPNGVRKVRLSIMANAPVSLYMQDQVAEDAILVGHGEAFSVEATAQGDSVLQIHTDPDTVVFYKAHTPDLKVNNVADEVFTTVEPMRKQRSELDQIKYLFKRNEERRNLLLDEERKALREEREAARRERFEDREERRKLKQERKAKRKEDKAYETSSQGDTTSDAAE